LRRSQPSCPLNSDWGRDLSWTPANDAVPLAGFLHVLVCCPAWTGSFACLLKLEGALPCIPPGGICCSGSTYVLPPDTCEGGSQPITTAGVPAVPSTITEAPSTSTLFTEVTGSYTYYSYTITWYYYYYYYTYLAEYYSTATYSYEITSYTTVSVSASDSAQASALFSSLSATLSLPTPAQTVTELSGSAPLATPTPPPAAPVPTTSASTTPTFSYGNATSPTLSPTPALYTGGASSGRVGAFLGSWIAGSGLMTALMTMTSAGVLLPVMLL
jgi:hypothetical protein